ncbi:MAG: hypothetical protein K0B11_18825 [Mariniphaga sp.]|nr:hypothetical protein [Mariniphaga sp.]
MKKIIGIFSLLLITGIMLFNVNLSSDSKTDADVNLVSLIAANAANSESGQNGCFYTSYWLDVCAHPPYVPKYLCEESYMFLCNQ